MGNMNDRDYDEYEDDDSIMEDDVTDYNETDSEFSEIPFLAKMQQQATRTWRDAEKYKELKELNRLINDELYVGFNARDFLGDEEY